MRQIEKSTSLKLLVRILALNFNEVLQELLRRVEGSKTCVVNYG